MPKKAPAPERPQQFTGEEGKEQCQCNWNRRKNNRIEMAVFLYIMNYLIQKKRVKYCKKSVLYILMAGEVCASFMLYFIALVKAPKPDTALHQPLRAHPFVLSSSPNAAVHFSQEYPFPPFLYRSNALPPSNCPGPLGLTLQNKWAFKTSPSGLQFASQRPGIAGKQRALFAKRILKQLPFTSAVQEC